VPCVQGSAIERRETLEGKLFSGRGEAPRASLTAAGAGALVGEVSDASLGETWTWCDQETGRSNKVIFGWINGPTPLPLSRDLGIDSRPATLRVRLLGIFMTKNSNNSW
jgi:hypothetical protein